MVWGFPLVLKGKDGKALKPKPVNNARADKLDSIMWRYSFQERRCLIPVTAFAEAEGEKGQMTRTWLSTIDQTLPACAGLWRGSDEWGDCYTMVMVDATDELFHIHDRMPVILHAADHDRWLHAAPEDAMTLVAKYPADRLAVERTDIPWFSRKAPPTEAPGLFP